MVRVPSAASTALAPSTQSNSGLVNQGFLKGKGVIPVTLIVLIALFGRVLAAEQESGEVRGFRATVTLVGCCIVAGTLAKVIGCINKMWKQKIK